MATAIEKYARLKKDVDEANEQAAKAAGALEQITTSLKKEFACDTLRQAKEKLKQMQKEEEGALEEFENALEEFKEEWDDDDDD